MEQKTIHNSLLNFGKNIVPEFFSTFDIQKGDPLWRDPEDLTIIW